MRKGLNVHVHIENGKIKVQAPRSVKTTVINEGSIKEFIGKELADVHFMRD